jgi:hypothetical protein
VKHHLFDPHPITRHQETYDGIVEQLTQRRLTIADIHGGNLLDVLLLPFATTQRLRRLSSSTTGSTVAVYRGKSFSVFLDKAEFKTRIGFIADRPQAFQRGTGFRIRSMTRI